MTYFIQWMLFLRSAAAFVPPSAAWPIPSHSPSIPSFFSMFFPISPSNSSFARWIQIPQSPSNAHHTSKANYFFDLQKSAFTTLADESVGELQMTFKVIPYPTSKNIGFISTTTQEWYLQGRFFNMRYPLKKIE